MGCISVKQGKLVSLLLILAIAFTGCSPISNTKVEQSPLGKSALEKYTTGEIKVYDDNQTDILATYQVLDHNNLQYLAQEDFIDLCNLMNKRLKLFKELDGTSYDAATHALSISYRKDANFKGDVIGWLLENGFKLVQRTTDGADNLQIIDFNTGMFSKLVVDQATYLPIEAIRTMIFNTDLYLFKLNPSEYVFLGDKSLNEGLKPVQIDEMLEPDSALFDESLEQLMILDGVASEVGELQDYTQYYFEVFKLVDQRNDYHAGVYLIAELSGAKLYSLGFDSFLKTSNKQKFDDVFNVSAPQTINWKQLNPSTYYIDVNSFGIAPQVFWSNLNKLKVELAEAPAVDKIVVDLRDNTGGFARNAIGLLGLFIKDELQFNLGYYVNRQLVSTQHYQLRRHKMMDSTYDLTVLVNEANASASLLFTSLLRDNADTVVIGEEPKFKRPLQVTYFQLLDGTIITESSRQFKLLDKKGEIFDEMVLVDQVMDDGSVEAWLGSLKQK